MKGKIIHVSEVETFKSDFKKRTFAIETDDKYPQKIGFELTKDNCDLVSSADVGKTAEVEFNIRGNEYNGKYYVSLQAWKVTLSGSADVQLPEPTEKQIQGIEAKLKTGDVTLEQVQDNFNLSNAVYLRLKSCLPTVSAEDDGLPF